jgi:hypothetical protein
MDGANPRGAVGPAGGGNAGAGGAAGLADKAKVRKTALDILRPRFGDKPVGLQAQAFIRLGVK